MPLTAMPWPSSKISSTCTHDLVLFSGLILSTVGPASDFSDQNDALSDIFLLCLSVERLTHGKCLWRNAGLWICGGGCCYVCLMCVSDLQWTPGLLYPIPARNAFPWFGRLEL